MDIVVSHKNLLSYAQSAMTPGSRSAETSQAFTFADHKDSERSEYVQALPSD